MEKPIKKRLQRLWRDRALISIGGLLVLGFSALQVQRVLKNRPIHRSWVLEYSQAAEVMGQENESEEELHRAIKKIHRISQERDLQITRIVFQSLDTELDQNQIQSLEMHFELARAKARLSAPELELAQELTQELTQELELAWELAQELELTQELTQELELAWKLAQGLELTQELELAWELAQGLEQSRTRTRELYVVSEIISVRFDKLIRTLNQADKILLTLIVATDLEITHGYTLQQGDMLKRVLSSEPNRARNLMQSGILLSLSTLVLIGLLVMLIRMQGSQNLPRAANLIALLPEECVAELGYLERRLKKTNKSSWQIRRRLIHEFVFLLWVHYVPMQLDNLFLGSDQDHTIDD